MTTPATQADQEIAIAEYERIATEVRAKAATIPAEDWELVTGGPVSAHQPKVYSVRMSDSLIEELDKIAAQQDRKRANLIQHILWEYVRKYKQPD